MYEVQLLLGNTWWRVFAGKHDCLVSATAHLQKVRTLYPDDQYRVVTV